MCRQRPGTFAAAPHEPALAERSGRHRGMDGDAAGADPEGRRCAGRRARRRLHRARPRRAGRSRSALRAQPVNCRRDARRGAACVRDQRPPAPAPAWISVAADRAGLVRDDTRQMAPLDHRDRQALCRLPAGKGLPPPHIGWRLGGTGRQDPSARAHGSARRAGFHVADPLPRARDASDRGKGVVGTSADRQRRLQLRWRCFLGDSQTPGPGVDIRMAGMDIPLGRDASGGV